MVAERPRTVPEPAVATRRPRHLAEDVVGHADHGGTRHARVATTGTSSTSAGYTLYPPRM